MRDISAHLKSATLSEHDSKSLLREAGIALPDEILVTDKGALEGAIGKAGFPLVMKIQSRDIPHKSEVGGVRVNIASKDEALEAYDALLESARKHRPEAAIQGVLLSPMAKKGVEIIVGTMLDKTFGPMIMVGLGGITTELFRDVIYRPAPVSAAEATGMLGELKAAPLLNGFRGAAQGRCAGAGATDLANFPARRAAERPYFGDRDQSGAGASEGQGVTIVDALVVGKNSRHSGHDAAGRITVIPDDAVVRQSDGTHRPLKFPARRSSVAFTPSLKSSVARNRVCSASS